MSEPPGIIRYRVPKSRLSNTNQNRMNINEYGLKIPSKKSENYEPPMNNTELLLNGSTGYNYRKEARAKRNMAWTKYQANRAAAASRNKPKNSNSNNKKNGTRKTLFGGRRCMTRRNRH